MAIEDPNDLKRIDQEIRINELKQEADQLAGGKMIAWEADGCPPELAEQFWANVVAYEKAPSTSHFQQLRQAGVEMPPPESLDDRQVADKLAEIFAALAQLRVFVSNTNHLSDRELYTALVTDVLHEWTQDIPPELGWTCCLDMVGSGSDEHIELYLKYYADDEWRARWARDFPDMVIPEHVDPPYDRDRHLPRDS
jgi:hypothetical protein